ncbi:MAG TPA: hypothetical protein VEH29_04030, partial [Acidimicrobiales bacterium]|nr:hypothetical protein [Acidimicrobiales bacterium]
MGIRPLRVDRRLEWRHPVYRALSVLSAGVVAAGVIATGAAASSGALRGELLPHKAPSPGKWTPLDPAIWPWAAPGVTVLMGPGDTASALWEREVSSSKYTYEVAKIGPDGGIVQEPTSIFGSDAWGSLSPFPTLLPYGKGMVVVFDGTRGTTGLYSGGCIVGASSAAPTWVLQTWSLSKDCIGNNGGATVTRNGTLSADWLNGHQIDYRVGVSPTIPADTPDSDFLVPGNGDPDSASEVTDLAGSDDVYAAWNQNNSSPATDNGFWVKDLMGGSAMKAPGSGLNSVSNFPE